MKVRKATTENASVNNRSHSCSTGPSAQWSIRPGLLDQRLTIEHTPPLAQASITHSFLRKQPTMTVLAPAVAEAPTSPSATPKVAASMGELRQQPNDLQRYLWLRRLQRCAQGRLN